EMNIKITEARIIDGKIYVEYEQMVDTGSGYGSLKATDEKIFNSFPDFTNWLKEKWEIKEKK
ncbi:unnamed protein product, partial [marine sediment metagenome]